MVAERVLQGKMSSNKEGFMEAYSSMAKSQGYTEETQWNPKLDNREVYMPMKDRPIVKMMMQNSAHILCLNEADALESPNDEKPRELIKTFIRLGYKGIVIKQWSSRPIACCPRRTFCKSGTTGKTYFHQESELGNHIRNVQVFLRNRRKLH